MGNIPFDTKPLNPIILNFIKYSIVGRFKGIDNYYCILHFIELFIKVKETNTLPAGIESFILL